MFYQPYVSIASIISSFLSLSYLSSHTALTLRFVSVVARSTIARRSARRPFRSHYSHVPPLHKADLHRCPPGLWSPSPRWQYLEEVLPLCFVFRFHGYRNKLTDTSASPRPGIFVPQLLSLNHSSTNIQQEANGFFVIYLSVFRQSIRAFFAHSLSTVSYFSAYNKQPWQISQTFRDLSTLLSLPRARLQRCKIFRQ